MNKNTINHLKICLLSLFILLLSASIAHAQPPSACQKLDPEAQKQVNELLSSTFAYQCCDTTLEKCLLATPVCPSVTSMKEQICRLVNEKKSKADIKRLLQKRALSMTDTHKAIIETTPGLNLGNANAKVTISAYLCARCPYCAKYIPALIKALKSNDLLSKVSLNIRLFPIKSHEHSTAANLAVSAAAQHDKGIEYLLLSYAEFETFSPTKPTQWASKIDLDATTFEKTIKDPNTRKELIKSKKEGLKNNVESTPTLFINGKKLRANFSIETVVDLIREELANNP